MEQQQGYIRSLDGVRAIAILLVMSFHANITHFGWMGVQLFFVLSGFLITGILWKEKTKPQSLSFKFRKFWFRRVLRIFPLYFGYLIVLGITYLVFNFPHYYPTYAPYLFTYTVNFTRTLIEWQGNPLFTHLWSLSIEEQFYIVFPFVIFLLPSKYIKFLLVLFIFLSPFVRFFLYRYYTHQGASSFVAADAVYWNTLSHLDAFFIGGMIPVFSLEKKINKASILLLLAALLVLAFGLWSFITAGASDYLLNFGYDHAQSINYQYVWQYTLLNLLFASFLLYLLSTKASKSRSLKLCMENSVLVRIGKVSYGMYMFHWAVYVYVFKQLLPSETLLMKIIYFIPYTLAVYLLSEISFRFFEKRFLQLKDKLFISRRNSQKMETSAFAGE